MKKLLSAPFYSVSKQELGRMAFYCDLVMKLGFKRGEEMAKDLQNLGFSAEDYELSLKAMARGIVRDSLEVLQAYSMLEAHQLVASRVIELMQAHQMSQKCIVEHFSAREMQSVLNENRVYLHILRQTMNEALQESDGILGQREAMLQKGHPQQGHAVVMLAGDFDISQKQLDTMASVLKRAFKNPLVFRIMVWEERNAKQLRESLKPNGYDLDIRVKFVGNMTQQDFQDVHAVFCDHPSISNDKGIDNQHVSCVATGSKFDYRGVLANSHWVSFFQQTSTAGVPTHVTLLCEPDIAMFKRHLGIREAGPKDPVPSTIRLKRHSLEFRIPVPTAILSNVPDLQTASLFMAHGWQTRCAKKEISWQQNGPPTREDAQRIHTLMLEFITKHPS